MLVGASVAVFARVALFTRAWIEMVVFELIVKIAISRPLHEGVD